LKHKNQVLLTKTIELEAELSNAGLRLPVELLEEFEQVKDKI